MANHIERIISILAGVILLNQLAFGESSDIWWDSIDSKWCMRSNTRLACLQSGFQLNRVTDDTLHFIDRTNSNHSYFLTFEKHVDVERSYQLFVDDAFQLVRQYEQNDLNVFVFRPDPLKATGIDMHVVVISVDKTHTIVLHGKEAQVVSNTIDSIVSQWVDVK